MTTGPGPTPPPAPEPPEEPRTLEAALERDLEHARAYGTAALKLPENLARDWDSVAPRLRAGWADRHRELCHFPHDWRNSFLGVRHGWLEAGAQAPKSS
jgi:hypothetical protein